MFRASTLDANATATFDTNVSSFESVSCSESDSAAKEHHSDFRLKKGDTVALFFNCYDFTVSNTARLPCLEHSDVVQQTSLRLRSAAAGRNLRIADTHQSWSHAALTSH